MSFMGFMDFWKNLGRGKQHYMPVFAQQAAFLHHAAGALCEMLDTLDHSQWRRLEKDVKACEVQGDALLTEFHEQLYENIISKMRRSDIQTIAMNVDDFLDHINGAAKSILLYCPVRFDAQLKDLAQYIYAETDAMKKMFALFDDIKRNYTQIVLQCDRITELEHAADDSYEEYIEYIFRNEENAVELIKYKNIAEALEGATDSAKRVSDSVRKIILRYTE